MAVSRARALLLLAATALGLLSIASASILFTPVPFPFSNQQKHSSLSSASVVIGNKVSVASNNKYTDGAYQLLTRTGGRVAESGWVHHLSGQLKDKTGAPIKQLSIPVDRTNFTGYVTLSTVSRGRSVGRGRAPRPFGQCVTARTQQQVPGAFSFRSGRLNH